jgi:hypothetical protein
VRAARARAGAKGGTSVAYLVPRLERDHPEIAEALARGEFRSVRAAALAAGIIKPPARNRGVRPGGLNATSIANRDEANTLAEALRPILTELSGLSSRAIAAEFNARDIVTPSGGRWHSASVLRLQRRLHV